MNLVRVRKYQLRFVSRQEFEFRQSQSTKPFLTPTLSDDDEKNSMHLNQCAGGDCAN